MSSTAPFFLSFCDPSSSRNDETYTHVFINDDFILSDPVEVVGRLLILEEEESNRFGGAGRRSVVAKVSFFY